MLPPQRVSHGRTRRRRTHHALEAVYPTLCPVSGQAKQHHQACNESGYVRAGLTIKVPKLGIGVPKKGK
jgi:ribosomal protein L32